MSGKQWGRLCASISVTGSSWELSISINEVALVTAYFDTDAALHPQANKLGFSIEDVQNNKDRLFQLPSGISLGIELTSDLKLQFDAEQVRILVDTAYAARGGRGADDNCSVFSDPTSTGPAP